MTYLPLFISNSFIQLLTELQNFAMVQRKNPIIISSNAHSQYVWFYVYFYNIKQRIKVIILKNIYLTAILVQFSILVYMACILYI